MSEQLLPFHILLVDDNEHESFFFKNVLKDLPFSTHFSSTDGEKLMNHLEDSFWLPHILFLDLNMPCKNGFECLHELKTNEKFKYIPVIMYSTSFDNKVADELYKNGAHHYVQKTDVIALKKILSYFLTIMTEETFIYPPREKFLITDKSANLKP